MPGCLPGAAARFDKPRRKSVTGPLGPVSPSGQELSVKLVSPVGSGLPAGIEAVDEVEIWPGLVGNLDDHHGTVGDFDDHCHRLTPVRPADRGPGAAKAAARQVSNLAPADQPQRPGLQAPSPPPATQEARRGEVAGQQERARRRGRHAGRRRGCKWTGHLGRGRRWPPRPVMITVAEAAISAMAATTISQRREGNRKSCFGPKLISSSRHTPPAVSPLRPRYSAACITTALISRIRHYA